MPFESLGHGPLMHTPKTKQKKQKKKNTHTVIQTSTYMLCIETTVFLSESKK